MWNSNNPKAGGETAAMNRPSMWKRTATGEATTGLMNVSLSLIIGGETLENGDDKTELCEINKKEHPNRQHQRVGIIMKDWRIL